MQDQRRVVIENVYPQINNGEFYIKRVLGETVSVTADILADGHEAIAASLLIKHQNEKKWSEFRMNSLGNEFWQATFKVEKQGFYTYKIQAWVDYALNWQHGIKLKIENKQHVSSELLEGVSLLEKCIKLASATDKTYLRTLQTIFGDENQYKLAIIEATSEKLYQQFLKYPEKFLANTSKEYRVYVDRLKARFSTWYEFFPRSASQQNGVHGTFKDCEALLPRIVEMGFDTLYFPPIHPIGEVNRKGKNNTTTSRPDDVGSCWGIGSQYGGHKAINPKLGTLSDFKSLIIKAKSLGIELAMDYALQAAPDHPWVKTHPKWFKWRPDGTVQYAENPPKKYQDILPIYFETDDFKALWQECLETLFFWIECGIQIFRVDNPHTKPFYFWNWIIDQVKQKYPDVLFLAEAFTGPKVMQQLAKQGFTQSYTYFTWRENKYELTNYVEELSKTNLREYFHPNFWTNTPDINPFHLQGANESTYKIRYVLAATLSSNTGIYGPVFEQMISEGIPGKEEYLNSEKFQICNYNWFKKNELINFISKVNKIRINHKALQQTNNIKFCIIENNNLMAFYKWDEDKLDEVLIVINLNPNDTQQAMLQIPLNELGITNGQQIEVTDLLTNNTYYWDKEWNFVELKPSLPCHIFTIKK